MTPEFLSLVLSHSPKNKSHLQEFAKHLYLRVSLAPLIQNIRIESRPLILLFDKECHFASNMTWGND